MSALSQIVGWAPLIAAGEAERLCFVFDIVGDAKKRLERVAGDSGAAEGAERRTS